MGRKEEALDRMADPEPNAIGVPSTELSLGWMLASRASLRFTRREVDTASEPRKQGQQELPVRKAGKSVAKEWPFFVQRMGSTLRCRVGQAARPVPVLPRRTWPDKGRARAYVIRGMTSRGNVGDRWRVLMLEFPKARTRKRETLRLAIENVAFPVVLRRVVRSHCIIYLRVSYGFVERSGCFAMVIIQVFPARRLASGLMPAAISALRQLLKCRLPAR